jgi:hypothetical protein
MSAQRSGLALLAVLALSVLALASATFESRSDVELLPSASESLSLRKALTRSSHLRRKNHMHKPRFRKGQDGGMYGSLFLTYLAEVSIAGEKYECIMDTGSSDFAVAASEQCGCQHYYKGTCDGTMHRAALHCTEHSGCLSALPSGTSAELSTTLRPRCASSSDALSCVLCCCSLVDLQASRWLSLTAMEIGQETRAPMWCISVV